MRLDFVGGPGPSALPGPQAQFHHHPGWRSENRPRHERDSVRFPMNLPQAGHSALPFSGNHLPGFRWSQVRELGELGELSSVASLGSRVCACVPPLEEGRLWRVQQEAIANLERSLADNRPRSLIQMATGSGKTFTAA